MSETDQVRAVRDYYLDDNDGEPSIYHVWEKGAGRGNVTTPSTSSEPYRQWITQLLRGLLAEGPDLGLLSVGCGNGVVEAGLVAEGLRVLGVDPMEPAVELTKAKGVDVVCADALTWTPPPGRWSVVYADGSLGHLYDPDTGVRPALERFKSWLPEGGVLVLSVDPPWNGEAEVSKHSDLRYYFLPQAYLCRQVEECGFRDVSSTVFVFEKPLTGPRDRLVVTARV
ncbi:MAG: class I SAM-dependent methyltransferase [Jatrophihabitantaceae bacterium]